MHISFNVLTKVKKKELATRSWRTLMAMALFLGLAMPQMVSAASPSSLTLTSDTQIPTWTGTVQRDAPPIAGVPECANGGCDVLQLNVNLPRDVLGKAGEVVVGIRFSNELLDTSLGLVVYNASGVKVGSSTASVGTSQAVALPLTKYTVSSSYTVYIVDEVAFGNTEPVASVPYEGITQVHYLPVNKPKRNLLPDLIALPQTNITLDAPFDIFNDHAPAGSNCFQSEIDESGAHDCLRFDQNLANIGEGALDLRFKSAVGITPTDGQLFPVVQRIYRSDGTFNDVSAGNVEWHAIHQHYHFVGFAQSKMWATDASGTTRVGTSPVATGDKVSFCIADTNINPSYWGVKSFSAQAYPAPDCLTPDSTSGGFNFFKQGMSAGWSDEYNWFLPGQYVEVTGVPDGTYILDTTVDPTGRLQEANTTNNCGSVRVQLTGMGTTAKHAELLGTGPACTS